MLDTAGSAAAPAARCRNRRRGSFIAVLLPDRLYCTRVNGRGHAMRAWIDRTNDGLSGMPADGISLPPKRGDFGTSRWAGSKVSLHQPCDWVEGHGRLWAHRVNSRRHFGRFRSAPGSLRVLSKSYDATVLIAADYLTSHVRTVNRRAFITLLDGAAAAWTVERETISTGWSEADEQARVTTRRGGRSGGGIPSTYW